VSDLFELEKRRSVERKAGGTVDVWFGCWL
jgi:hypothetical protein